MMMIVCSVLDTKVGAFLPPFFMRSKGEALRAFSDTVRDEKSSFNRNRADFQLFLLGTWDDTTGVFGMPPQPERLIGADEVE